MEEMFHHSILMYGVMKDLSVWCDERRCFITPYLCFIIIPYDVDRDGRDLTGMSLLQHACIATCVYCSTRVLQHSSCAPPSTRNNRYKSHSFCPRRLRDRLYIDMSVAGRPNGLIPYFTAAAQHVGQRLVAKLVVRYVARARPVVCSHTHAAHDMIQYLD